MKEAKRSHAVSVVNFEDYSQWCDFNTSILITGGLSSANTKAEIYIPARNKSCKLPDLPVRRYYHTQDGFLTCGGSGGNSQLCHTWDPETGTWPVSHNLPTGREQLSWTPRSGNGTYLIGQYWQGWDHAETTTLVKPDGSVVSGFKVNRTEYVNSSHLY